MKWLSVGIWLILLMAIGCQPHSQNNHNLVFLTEEVAQAQVEGGAFYYYLPSAVDADLNLLVLVHGTPVKGETAVSTAHYYLNNWRDFADKNQFILIAPAFDQLNYSSKDGQQALGGYRGLFGRTIGADQFLLNIIDAVQQANIYQADRFYLYGHSAGGQFTARFIMQHPERIKGAIISAPATYPQPTDAFKWPYGLAPLDGTLQWLAPEEETAVSITPNIEKWLTAVALPVTVIVGLDDRVYQPDRTGQKGNSRIVIAHNWVSDIDAFAAAHGVESQIKLSIIPNQRHSSTGLMPFCQDEILRFETHE